MSVLLTRQGPLLKLNAVTRRVEGVTVLDQISLTVEVGERIGLVGPSGAGKSALLDVITGLSPATAGSIWYDGRPLLGLGPERVLRLGISRTFPEPRPLPGATVRRTVELAAAAAVGIAVRPDLRYRAGRRERIERAADLALERCGLLEHAERPPDALDWSQCAYLEIARALASEPQLVLLDQPTTGFDARDRRAFAAFVGRLNAEGITVVLADHDLALVAELCPRVIVLHRGRRLADGPPDRVGALPEVLRAFTGLGAL